MKTSYISLILGTLSLFPLGCGTNSPAGVSPLGSGGQISLGSGGATQNDGSGGANASGGNGNNDASGGSDGTCQPNCTGRVCGDDMCGGECGTCSDGQACSVSGQCVAPGTGHPVERHGHLKVSGNKLVDEHGVFVQLRGVSTQWLNWEQEYSTDRAGLEFMRDSWGLEIIRIANGVEADNGYADERVRAERLAMVKDIIDSAISLGIYVLVDWHTHEIEHLELAKTFFTEIATAYGDQPHVLYEPFNEPIGPFDSEAPGSEMAFWENELKPYHQEIVDHIRQIDPDNVIILGTPLWSQGVHRAAASPVSGTNLAYTVHFYSCTHDESLMNRVKQAMDDGIAIFATEWASAHADGGTDANPTPCIAEARAWHDFLDQNSIGSTAWKLSSDGDVSAILAGDPASSGGWTENDLSEHGKFVAELLSRP